MLTHCLWNNRKHCSHSIPSSPQSTKMLQWVQTSLLSSLLSGPGFDCISPDKSKSSMVCIMVSIDSFLFSMRCPYLLNRLIPKGLICIAAWNKLTGLESLEYVDVLTNAFPFHWYPRQEQKSAWRNSLAFTITASVMASVAHQNSIVTIQWRENLMARK